MVVYFTWHVPAGNALNTSSMSAFIFLAIFFAQSLGLSLPCKTTAYSLQWVLTVASDPLTPIFQAFEKQAVASAVSCIVISLGFLPSVLITKNGLPGASV